MLFAIHEVKVTVYLGGNVPSHTSSVACETIGIFSLFFKVVRRLGLLGHGSSQ